MCCDACVRQRPEAKDARTHTRTRRRIYNEGTYVSRDVAACMLPHISSTPCYTTHPDYTGRVYARECAR